MLERTVLEFCLPMEALEKMLARILIDEGLSCSVVPFDDVDGVTMRKVGLSKDRLSETDALREAIDTLEDMKAMGLISRSASRLEEEKGHPVDRVRKLVAAIRKGERQAMNPEDFSLIREDCLRRLRFLDALSCSLKGRYAACFRLSFSSQELPDLDKFADPDGPAVVVRQLGSEKADKAGLFSGLLRGKK